MTARWLDTLKIWPRWYRKNPVRPGISELVDVVLSSQQNGPHQQG
jgi:hypothetical protein